MRGEGRGALIIGEVKMWSPIGLGSSKGDSGGIVEATGHILEGSNMTNGGGRK